MIEINNSEEHIKVINETSSVVLDFWAPWCGPCKALMPMLEKMSEDYSNVTFAKINVVENRGIADLYNVTAVPTIVYLNKGQKVFSHVGVTPYSSIEEKVNSIINE